jgi:hypothetical protein
MTAACSSTCEHLWLTSQGGLNLTMQCIHATCYMLHMKMAAHPINSEQFDHQADPASLAGWS